MKHLNFQSVRLLICFTSKLSNLRLKITKKSPGHALHEKGLQRQIGVDTLASNQEQRALLVPVINRELTAGGCPRRVSGGGLNQTPNPFRWGVET